jgi:aprataxin
LFNIKMNSIEVPDESSPPKKRNAFSELMSPKPKQPKPTSHQPHWLTKTTTNLRHTDRRDGLLDYIQNPTSFPPTRVIYHNTDFVVTNDLYPKGSVHLLLLPRDPSKYLLHPFDAFSDPVFLASVRAEAAKLKSLAAKELRRLFGSSSTSDQVRLSAMDAYPPPATLPAGRDWTSEIMIGIHARPSMNHLHVHIISKDRYGDCLRHRKHYNSFSTPFFVPLDDFPLAEDDVRRHPGREGYLKRDLVCWKCGMEFGNRFTKLKEHLKEEFEAWKKE